MHHSVCVCVCVCEREREREIEREIEQGFVAILKKIKNLMGPRLYLAQRLTNSPGQSTQITGKQLAKNSNWPSR